MLKQQDILNETDKQSSLTPEESQNPLDVTAQSVVTDRSLNRSNSSARKQKRKTIMEDIDVSKIEPDADGLIKTVTELHKDQKTNASQLGELKKQLEQKLNESSHTVTQIKILNTLIDCYGGDPDLYWKRAHCYRQIEMFLDATEDLQRAADMRPYAQASISNKSFYESMTSIFRSLGLDFN